VQKCAIVLLMGRFQGDQLNSLGI